MIPYPTLQPYFLKIGQVEFRWYGLMYALSFLIGYYLCVYLVNHVKRFVKSSLRKEQLLDLMFYILLGVIIGGRLGYVLFYNLPYFIENPPQIVAFWSGGMSFHGGLIGVVAAGLWFCKKHGIHPYDIGDLLVLAVPVGLGLGRIGNFINGELYGRVTDVPWCMQFPSALSCRHPSQIYEFLLEGVILFLVLWFLKNRPLPKGFLFWTFFLLYGIFRFAVEYVREPDSQIGMLGWLTMGQILSLPLIILGIIGLFLIYKHSSQ